MHSMIINAIVAAMSVLTCTMACLVILQGDVVLGIALAIFGYGTTVLFVVGMRNETKAAPLRRAVRDQLEDICHDFD